MDNNSMFRVALFGGYNKNDVQEYTRTLENEIEAVKVLHQKEKNDLLKKIESLELQQRASSSDSEKLNNLQGQLEEKEKLLNTHLDEISDLQKQLEQLTSNTPDFTSEIESLKNTIQENEKTIAEKEELLKSNEALLAQKDAEVATVKEELEKLEAAMAENVSISSDVSSSTSDLLQIKAELDSKSALLQASYSEIARLKSEIANTSKNDTAPDSNLTSQYEAKMAEKDALIASLQETIRHLSDELVRAEAAINAGSRVMNTPVSTVSAEELAHWKQIAEDYSRREEDLNMNYRMSQQILEEAKKSAADIIQQAQTDRAAKMHLVEIEAEEYKKTLTAKMDSEAKEKGLEMLQARYRINYYLDKLTATSDGLSQIREEMAQLVSEMPVRSDYYFTALTSNDPAYNSTSTPNDSTQDNILHIVK